MKTTAIKMKSAKAKAWKAFSLYIRTRDSINGMCSCITCGKTGAIKDMQAGHFLGGRSGSVLFEEDLVYAQCVGCNIFLRGNYGKYMLKMLDMHGRQWVDDKEKQKTNIKQYKTQDYLDIAEKYKQKLKEITL